MLTCYFIELSICRNFLQEQIIKLEQQRSDELLLDILPAPIAERLKRGENVADYLSDVSVLFADIVDFTPISQKLAPSELIGFLNDTFSIFDQLAQKYGLEKIKAIGDC
jgi:class 3 adenylate cyclase